MLVNMSFIHISTPFIPKYRNGPYNDRPRFLHASIYNSYLPILVPLIVSCCSKHETYNAQGNDKDAEKGNKWIYYFF